MSEKDFVVIGIVEMSYNWLSYGVIHDVLVLHISIMQFYDSYVDFTEI